MSTTQTTVKILSVDITDQHLVARFSDGRVVSNPLKWYPRLLKAKAKDRAAFEISGDGYGVHWEKLDEDLSAKGIASGTPSIEYRALMHR